MTQQDWTVQTLLADMAGRGDHAAVMAFHGGEVTTVSYAALAADALAFARGLRHAGAQSGERVLLIGPNGADLIAARLALGAAGLISMSVDDLSPPTDIQVLAAAAPPDWVIGAAKHLDTLRPLAPAGRLVCLDADDQDGAPSWRTLLAETGDLPPVDPAAPTALLQTSGTTGAPKLFNLNHRHIGANVLAIAAEGLISQDDRLVLPLPLHHAYPQVVGLLTPLAAGAVIVLPESVTGPSLVEALKGSEASGLIGVPRLYDAIISAIEQNVAAKGGLARTVFNTMMSASIAAQRHLGIKLGRVLFRPLRGRLSANLRLLVSGGAKLDPLLTWKLAAIGFNVHSGYGLAETASTTTGNLPGRDRLGSEGRPFQGAEVRIFEPNEEGIGEVQLRGPNVFDGYVDPEANKTAFTEDGWYRTGDTGYLDADKFLFITGRIKEAIVLGGGKKVSPEDLERVYGESALIAEIAVLEKQGGLVALVRPDEAEIAKGSHAKPDDAIRITLSQAGETLAPYQRLAGYALTRDELPRTRLGKYRRFMLPELYDEAKRGPARRAASAEPVVEPQFDDPRDAATWQVLRDHCRDQLRGLDDHLALDLGIDSLAWITLSLEIQQKIGVDLSDTDTAQLITVQHLLDAVREAPDAAPASGAEVAARWLRPPAPLYRTLAGLLYGANRLLMRMVFQLKVTGTEHLPAAGPFVIACNHLSDLDPLVVAAALPGATRRQTRWGAEITRLFEGPRWDALYLGLRLFPMSDVQPAQGLACARATLDNGDVLVWFPESWRSPDGNLQAFQPGIGHLLAGTEVPVVPACIRGTFEALPRTRRWPRPHAVAIRFGAPVMPGDLATRGEGSTDIERVVNALRPVVAEVCTTV
ncbi:MAG: AMP-binding protein [Pseudomonadota bacterium]